MKEKVKKYDRSEIFKSAWATFKAGKGTFSECLKRAWAEAQNRVFFDELDFAMFDVPEGAKTESLKDNVAGFKRDLKTKGGIARFIAAEKIASGYEMYQL